MTGEYPGMAIRIKKSRRELLHRKEGIPQGQKIPAGTLQHDLHSNSEALRKEAQFAINARKWNHSR